MKLSFLLALNLAVCSFGGEVIIGTKDKVTYSGTATEADATITGKTLLSIGFFSDDGKQVMVEKGNSGAILSFLVSPRRWNMGHMQSFEQIARMTVGVDGGLGFPVRVRILTPDLQQQAESVVSQGVLIGTKDQVNPSGLATSADAKQLGDVLKKDGFFQELGVTVLLHKSAGEPPMITFTLPDKDIGRMLAIYEVVMHEIAEPLGGLPLKLRLLNPEWQVKRDLLVHPTLTVGKDKIYYSGTATREEAQALAAIIKTEELFGGAGITVLLSKTNAGAVVSIPVKKDKWNEPEVQQYYKNLGTTLASEIGGLPIKVRLLDDTFNQQWETEIQ